MLFRIATVAVATATMAIPALGQGTLVWADEFNGTSLSADWEAQLGDGSQYGIPGWGNNELQSYTARSQNLYVTGGNLHIVARRENYDDKQYTSARIRTAGRQAFKYGRFEGRMKIPSGTGIWPAFWMLPDNSPYGGWAASGELDIMESINQATTIYGTTHHGGTWPDNVSAGTTFNNGTDFSQDFHVYAIEWEPDVIRWYIDGIQYHSVPSSVWYSTASSNARAPFNQDFHFLLNVAVGGNFPGNPNGGTPFPLEMVVDWVRVYELDGTPVAQAPFGGSPNDIPGIIEAEDFDTGGPGIAYNDVDPGNNGGAYRDEGVDIEASTEFGHNVGYIRDTEWIEYTVEVAQSGTYAIDTRVASANNGGTFHLEIDGEDVTGPISVPATNGWQNWVTVSAEASIPQGLHVMRFVTDNGEYNINRFQFQAITPFVDWNGSGRVTIADLLAFLTQWFALDPATDIDMSGNVNAADLLEFLACWFPATSGGTCP